MTNHTTTHTTDSAIRPFTIAIPQSTLDDLRERLARTRWTDEVAGSGWDYGISLAYMKELVDYWQHTYDWRTHEAALNTFAQFKANVDGVGIHFIHERGKGPNPTPLLLIHGFPDSFYRYHKVIDRLTDPAKYGGDPNNSFDVIVPSIPGTGFSDRITKGVDDDADLFAKLMTEVLGYPKFVSAGGDHGNYITQSLARRYPALLIGIHLTDVGAYPDQNTDFSTLSPAEIEMAQWIQKWFMEEGIGVNMVMATKPQTLAYGLNDLPVGLAAWLVSYSSSGQKGKEEFKTRFSADEVLTNVMIYWVTETINSAARSYYANAHLIGAGTPERSAVPAAVAHCPYDPPLPREWAARSVNLVRFTEFPRGGHFMAWEEPELYAKDIQDFMRELRN